MLSLGMLCARAAWIALRRRGLALGSPPPVFAAMVISFDNLLKILPRLASIAPLKRLTFDHLLCPAIGAELFFDLSCLTKCCSFGTAPRKRMAGEEELPALLKRKKRACQSSSRLRAPVNPCN